MPKAQAVLGSYLDSRPAEMPGFSPAEAVAKRLSALAAAHRMPLNRGNRPGTNRKLARKKSLGQAYTDQSYRQAICRAWRRAGVGVWHPNQLRHEGRMPPPVRLGRTVRWSVESLMERVAAGCPPDPSPSDDKQ